MPTAACTMLPPQDNDFTPHVGRGGVDQRKDPDFTTYRLHSVNLYRATSTSRKHLLQHLPLPRTLLPVVPFIS